MKPRISIFEHAVDVLCSHASDSVLASTQDIPIRLVLPFWEIKHQPKQCSFLNTLFIKIVFAHGPKLNNETGMVLHACFYFRGKKENSTKKKNKNGDICILINCKFLCKFPSK